MVIRDEKDVDVDAVQEVVASAFRGKPYSSGTEPFIMRALRDGGGAVISLVAEEDGLVVGQVAFSPITIDGAERGWHALGPVAVRPDRQGRGIGKALIRHGIERLGAIGSAGCVLVGDPGYYRRFGFRPDPKLRYPDAPAEYFMILPLGTEIPTGRVGFHEAFSATA